MKNKDFTDKLKEYKDDCRISLYNGSSLTEYIGIEVKSLYVGGGIYKKCIYLYAKKGYSQRFSNKELQSILSKHPDDMQVYRSDGYMRNVEIQGIGYHESSFGKYIEL